MGEQGMRAFDHPTRREFVAASGLLAGGLAIGGGELAFSASALAAEDSAAARSPDEVLRKLLEGNRRFMRGESSNPRRKPEDFGRLAEGQTPMAVVVGCADSRVPPELLFDQG